MPELVRPGLKLSDVQSRRTLFRRVRIGQIFYRENRWWSKRTTRTAVSADSSNNDPVFFKGAVSARVFDESLPALTRQPEPESLEAFLAKAAQM